MTLLDAWDEPGPTPRPIIRLPRVEVRLPPIEEVAELWHLIVPLLAKATARTGCYEPIDLLAMAMRGQVGIWVCEVDGAIDAAAVSEIKQYPRKRVLEIMLLGGGNMAAWTPAFVETLDAHARQTGCEHIAAVGRPGWARIFGATPSGEVLLVRELKE